jgi:hypothetical protein
MSSTSEYAAIVPESVTDADASYVIEAVESAAYRSVLFHGKINRRKQRTRVERIGHGVEHVRVHVGVDGPVGGGVVARGDEDGVALGDGECDEVDWVLFDVGSVDLEGSQVSLNLSCALTRKQTSITRMSWPSIQKKNMAKAEVLTTRRR